jgi:hypothetical protein
MGFNLAFKGLRAVLKIMIFAFFEYFYHGATALMDQGLLIVADSCSHTDTPQ